MARLFGRLTALAQVYCEALPNSKKTASCREPSKSWSCLLVGSPSTKTKNVASASSNIFLLHHSNFERNTRETVLPNELQNGSGSSREAKEPEPCQRGPYIKDTYMTLPLVLELKCIPVHVGRLARRGTGTQKHGPQRHGTQKHISNYGPCLARTCALSSSHDTAHN